MQNPNGTGTVIVQWRDPDSTAVCLKHVRALVLPPRVIIVVDNESKEDIREAQAGLSPEVTFVGLARNEGHPCAVNIGARIAMDLGCEYLLLLDNDAFVTPSCLEKLEGILRAEPSVGAVSPLILSGRRPGLIWYGGGKVSFLGNSVHECMWKPADQAGRSTRAVEFVTSCALLVRFAAFTAVGGFDSSLHAYTDDLDFSLRLRRAGYSLLYAPAAEVTHGESVNVIKVAGKPFRDYYTMRNRLIVIRRHGTWLQKLLGIPLSILWYGAAYAAVFLLRGEWRRSRALCRGILDFMLGRSGMREV